MPESSTRSTASARHLVHVEQAVLFFLHEVVEGLGDLHLALLRALPKRPGSMSLRLMSISSAPWLERISKLRLVAVADIEFDEPVVELALAELLAQLLARGAVALGWRAEALACVFDPSWPAMTAGS